MKVLLLLVRGMHLGYLGCYGNEWISTPEIDRLATEGIVFDQHFINQLHLDPSAAEISTLGALGPSGDEVMDLLSGQGIKTYLLPRDESQSSTSSRAVAFEAALAGLAGIQDWYLCVDLNILLRPWRMPPVGQAGFSPEPAEIENPWLIKQGSYAAAVAEVDEEVARMRAQLESAGLLNDICWLITSDQGQAVDEERPATPPPPWLHEELIHIPLIVRLPQGSQASRRVEAFTLGGDVSAAIVTLACASGLPVQDNYLFELMQGDKRRAKRYVFAWAESAGAMSWALRTEDVGVLIRASPAPFDASRDARVFIKPEDRREVNNVAQHHLDLIEQTVQLLQPKDDEDDDQTITNTKGRGKP
jgi:hypothetical protein